MVAVSWLTAVPPGESVSVVGFRATLTPEGDPATVSLTLPPNPLILDVTMLSVPFDPARIIRLLGCAERKNVGVPVTVTDTGVDCWNDPLAPITVTV